MTRKRRALFALLGAVRHFAQFGIRRISVVAPFD
jgi:hypothetical protein